MTKTKCFETKVAKRLSFTSKLCEVAQVSVEDVAGLSKMSKMSKKKHTLLKQSKSDLDSLMSHVKSKFDSPITSYNKIQLLTLKPKPWTVNETSEFFNCFQNQVRTSK